MELLNILLVLCITVGLMSSRTSSYRHIYSARSSLPLDVMNFGAVGDEETDDSEAFLKAWNATCGGAAQNNALLEIPANKAFLVNSLKLMGPCTSPSITVRINGKLIAPSKISDWSPSSQTEDEWIGFYKVDGLTVTGNGIIDGQGQEWWQACENGNNECSQRPTALSFHHCDNLLLSGLNHINSQRNHISVTKCNGATVSGIHINAPETSPNTDGIDITSSVNVKVLDSVISTGDDCVAIGNNCAQINITGVFCGPGHGISVGSLGKNGEESAVEEIHVYNCTFSGTQNGARIKTWKGGSGYARKISFDKINIIEVDHPIIIDQEYTDFLQGIEVDHPIIIDQENTDFFQNKEPSSPSSSPSSSSSSAIEISDVTYTNFNGTSSGKGSIELKCSDSESCNNIVLGHIHIYTANPSDEFYSTCINAHVKAFDISPNIQCHPLD